MLLTAELGVDSSRNDRLIPLGTKVGVVTNVAYERSLQILKGTVITDYDAASRDRHDRRYSSVQVLDAFNFREHARVVHVNSSCPAQRPINHSIAVARKQEVARGVFHRMNRFTVALHFAFCAGQRKFPGSHVRMRRAPKKERERDYGRSDNFFHGFFPSLTPARFAKYIPLIIETTVVGIGVPENYGAQPSEIRSYGFFSPVHSFGSALYGGPEQGAFGPAGSVVPVRQPVRCLPPRLASWWRQKRPQLRRFAMAQAALSCARSALVFQKTPFDVIDRAGEHWLRGYQIGTALGYTQPSQAISKIYERNSDEFTDRMSAVIFLASAGGDQQTRIFSLRGAHLIGMLARTPVAKEFRRWVLDILDRELAAQQRDQTWDVSGAPDGTWAVVIENGIQRLVPLVHLYRQHYDAQGQHVPMANTKPAARAQAAAPYIRNQSGVCGVYPNQSKYNPWRAYVQRDGVSYNLGTYPTIAAARAAREQALIDLAAGRLPVARSMGGPHK